MKHYTHLADLQALVGQELGHSDWLLVEGSDDDEPVTIWMNNDNPDGTFTDTDFADTIYADIPMKAGKAVDLRVEWTPRLTMTVMELGILGTTLGPVVKLGWEGPNRLIADAVEQARKADVAVVVVAEATPTTMLTAATRADAMMVRDPPSSTARAAPKNRFGSCSAFASTPPESTLPDEGTTLL